MKKIKADNLIRVVLDGDSISEVYSDSFRPSHIVVHRRGRFKSGLAARTVHRSKYKRARGNRRNTENSRKKEPVSRNRGRHLPRKPYGV